MYRQPFQTYKQPHSSIEHHISYLEHIKHLDALFMLTKVSNLKVVANVLRTLADLFVNIAPLETIDFKGL